ncbi:hypothetical protein SERLA73DRAFT_73679 [Serpula lacrymans var. lacrymans S7.3]|uniref:Uncharacterized protein n=1 Tax=Serpula lacrymans var. lacrymans (strain S7.3) TaxID=936435 RepID=F8PZ09_SERL3|nr:hypothetical protein SERLA73DRAFT_73679 [Serpula lacrymans var. lacrymans S7.3]
MARQFQGSTPLLWDLLENPDLENPATENVDVAALNKLEEEHWAQVDEFDLEGMVKAAIDKPGN